MLPVKPISSREQAVPDELPVIDPVVAMIDRMVAALEEDDFYTQWESAKQLSRQVAQWGDRTIPYLINRLQATTNPDIQWFLVRILAQFDQIEVIEAIAQLLTTTQNEDLQTEICKALTHIGHGAIETVSELLDCSHPIERRILATRVLACIRRTATIEPLLSVAEDENPQIRAIAIEALGSFHDARITPVLLAALEERAAAADAPVCIEVIRTLGRRSDLLPQTDLVGPLQQCLLDQNSQIAKESAIALGRLGTKDAVVALGDALIRPVATTVKVAIVRALGWIDSYRSVQLLAIAFRQCAPLIMPAVKPEIARALGQTYDPSLRSQATQPLIDWLQTHLNEIHSNEIVNPDSRSESDTLLELKRAIVLALGRLGEIASIKALISLLASSDEQITIHILSALHQIDPDSAKAQLRSYLADEKTPIEIRNKVRERLKAW